MTTNVHLTIPSHVQTYLLSGEWERVGGVLRDSQTKQITGWLRDSQATDNLSILHPGSVSAGTFLRAGTRVNLALTAATLTKLLADVSQLAAQIQDLKSNLAKHFENEREVEFQSALRTAQMIVSLESDDNRHASALSAIRGLDQSFLRYSQLTIDTVEDNLSLACFYLSRAMQAATSCARCYAEIEEIEAAKKRLADDLSRLQHLSRNVVKALLGEHPGIFLHHALPKESVQHFFAIQEWLEPRDWLTIIDDVRSDFWNTQALDEGFWQRMRPAFMGKKDSRRDMLDRRLGDALFAIENLQRLEGFEMELRYLRLSGSTWRDWTSLVDEQSTEDLALIEMAQPVLLDT